MHNDNKKDFIMVSLKVSSNLLTILNSVCFVLKYLKSKPYFYDLYKNNYMKFIMFVVPSSFVSIFIGGFLAGIYVYPSYIIYNSIMLYANYKYIK